MSEVSFLTPGFSSDIDSTSLKYFSSFLLTQECQFLVKVH